MSLATEIHLRSLASMSRDEIGGRMIEGERLQGCTIVHDATWLDWNDWDSHTIISQQSRRIRLVALQAKQPGTGAFTRLISKIFAAGLVPVLVEPSQSLIDWCHRHDFRKRVIGRGQLKHDVWYPRRCAY